MSVRAETKLETLCMEWQERLHLLDWDVKVEFAESPLDFDKLGQTRASLPRKEAVITLMRPEWVEAAQFNFPTPMERTLVHELLHLHLLPIYEGRETDDVAEEQAIVAISKALVPDEG